MRLELTREGDYAIRAMLALAAHRGEAPLSSRRIADQWRIPQRFLVQVLGRLAERGLVAPVLGRSGGYLLARPADQISLLDVVTAVVPRPQEQRCVLRGSPCTPKHACLVHGAFTAAREQFLDELAGRSLETVLASSGWRPEADRPEADRPA